MVEMELNKIIIDEKRHDQVIVLKEKGGNRRLPIIIGFLEASSIKMKVSGMTPPRPLTHDLLKSTIENLDGKLDKVVIDKLLENTFHAKLIIKQDGKVKIVDARPSDSIALAVRSKAPIFVEEEVLEKASSLKEEQ
ncbi:MAG: bifunctional nuclease family protein [Candidatus Omnitrophica bacterium]|nr:bifunctional nuclease family protein [Candidatus Omnitrophota bacterium]